MKRIDAIVDGPACDMCFANQAWLLARVRELEAALEFYADPRGRVDEDGEAIMVPDFYDEYEFGETARATLAAAGEEE